MKVNGFGLLTNLVVICAVSQFGESKRLLSCSSFGVRRSFNHQRGIRTWRLAVRLCFFAVFSSPTSVISRWLTANQEREMRLTERNLITIHPRLGSRSSCGACVAVNLKFRKLLEVFFLSANEFHHQLRLTSMTWCVKNSMRPWKVITALGRVIETFVRTKPISSDNKKLITRTIRATVSHSCTWRRRNRSIEVERPPLESISHQPANATDKTFFYLHRFA